MGRRAPLVLPLLLALSCCEAGEGVRESGPARAARESEKSAVGADAGAGSSRAVRQDDGRFGKRPACEHSILFRDDKAIVDEKWSGSSGEKKGDSR